MRLDLSVASRHGCGVSYFITGTDTGAGKTRFSCLLIEALRAEGIPAAGYKPVCCGERDDALLLAAASGGLDPERVNPVWLKAPVAPLVGGMLEGRPVDVAAMHAGYRLLAAGMRWDPIVRHDGALSVRRAFVRGDWERLLQAAGVPRHAVTVRWHLPFRLCVGRRR